MALTDIEDDVAGSPPPPGDPSAPPGGGGGGGAPPGQGGGPVVAALARQSQGPQPSAPGPGNQADAMNKLLQAVQLIQQAAMGLQPGSPLHKDANNAVGRLSRHLPQGAPTAGVQVTAIRDLLRQIMQNSFLPQIMKQMGGGGGPGGGGPGPQQPPMPSTPLPGA